MCKIDYIGWRWFGEPKRWFKTQDEGEDEDGEISFILILLFVNTKQLFTLKSSKIL